MHIYCRHVDLHDYGRHYINVYVYYYITCGCYAHADAHARARARTHTHTHTAHRRGRPPLVAVGRLVATNSGTRQVPVRHNPVVRLVVPLTVLLDSRALFLGHKVVDDEAEQLELGAVPAVRFDRLDGALSQLTSISYSTS